MTDDSKDSGRIVLCGSQSFIPEMKTIRDTLLAAKIPVYMPDQEDFLQFRNNEAYLKFRKNIDYDHMKKIEDNRTRAVLAVNPNKHGIPNYLGPSTFGELAVGFGSQKKIFLYHGIPDIYKDELGAWEARSLHGDLSDLIKWFSEE